MNTNRKILIGAVSAAVVIGGVAIGLILSQTPEKADLSTIHTEAASETATETSATQAATQAQTEAASETAGSAVSVSAAIETYTQGRLSIQYPVVSRMADEEKQAKVNELLKANAISIITARGLDESADSLSVKCKVVSADQKRLTTVYTGELTAKSAAYPQKLFYANTVSLSQVQNIGLSDYTDAYTMAGYVLSDDVTFSGVTSEQKAAISEYRSTQDIDILTAVFDGADFPLASETAWPESFSYETQGTIYFSMPLPHALGDYVIVTFDPSTK